MNKTFQYLLLPLLGFIFIVFYQYFFEHKINLLKSLKYFALGILLAGTIQFIVYLFQTFFALLNNLEPIFFGIGTLFIPVCLYSRNKKIGLFIFLLALTTSLLYLLFTAEIPCGGMTKDGALWDGTCKLWPTIFSR